MKPIETAIVRVIARNNSNIVGVGFMISNKRVMTCAHVVATALGITRDAQVLPTATITLDFPLVDDNHPCTASVVLWLPPTPDGADDIAILELHQQRPFSTTVAKFVEVDEPWGKTFGAYGYPQSDGGWASGVVRGRIKGKRLQINNKDDKSYFIEPGFSGSPVYCDEAGIGGVIGMVSSGETDPDLEVGFMIPADVLLKWKDEQNIETVPTIDVPEKTTLLSSRVSTITAPGFASQVFSRQMQNRVVYIGKFQEMRRQLKLKRVFIAHPFFGGDTQEIADYGLFIKDGLGGIGYLPQFARDDSGTVLETVCQDIIDTEAGVYDVTGYNANVLIELGMSIGLNQPTVVIAQDDNSPLITPLQQLNPVRYESRYDLGDLVGRAVQERIQTYRKLGMSPLFCASCGMDCIARKPRQSPEDEYLIIGADPQKDKAIFHHLKKTAKNFNLTWQQLDGDFNLITCRWTEEIKRCKLVFFHSKDGTTQHSGTGNAGTMVRLGIAIGLGIAWRMILQQGERMPAYLEGYKHTTWHTSATAFDTALGGAVRQLLSEGRPYGGVYDALPPMDVFEEEEIEEIVVEVNAPTKFFMAPPLPANFVARSSEIETIVKELVDRKNQLVGITGITGSAGSGKTTLATAVCHDNRVQEKFRNGILWANLGETPNPIELLSSFIQVVTNLPPTLNNIEDAVNLFRKAMTSHSVLIVLDDVRSTEDVRPFIIANSDLAYFVTTRNEETLQQLKATLPYIEKMGEAEAIQLLAEGLTEKEVENSILGLREIAARAGDVPLLLTLVNSQLRNRLNSEDTLESAIKLVIEQMSATNAAGSVAEVLRIGINAISGKVQDLFQQLAVFAEDARIPISSIARLWQIDSIEVESICQQLARQSLLTLGSGYVNLHDVVRNYLVEQINDVPQLHAHLLDVWGDKYNLPDVFAWQHYIYHTINAGRDAKALLLDPQWIQAKLKATSLGALLEDFAHFPDDQTLQEAATRIRIEQEISDDQNEESLIERLNRLSDEKKRYILSTLILHLVNAGQYDRARTFLLNQEWLQAKLDVLGLDALLEDFVYLPNDADIQQTAETIFVNRERITSGTYSLKRILDDAAQIQPVPQTAFVFISFSRKNRDFVFRIEADLERLGIKTWSDDTATAAGNRQELIDNAVQQCSAAIVVMSKDSLESQYVQAEISRLLDLKKVVIPVLIGTPQDIPNQLVTLNYADFTSNYNDAMDRLVEKFGSNLLGQERRQRSSRNSKRIFIAYVRRDTSDISQRLFDLLNQEGFNSFRDFSSIPLGTDFSKVLRDEIDGSDVILAIISQNALKSEWWVKEISWAFEMGKLIIPILSNGESMPLPASLPGEIRQLTYLGAMAIRNQQFESDFQRLVDKLQNVDSQPSTNNRDFVLTQNTNIFINAIQPTNGEIENARQEINALREKLQQVFSGVEELEKIIRDISLFGSLARNTAITPVSDIDALVVFKIDPQKQDPKTTYEILETGLLKVYGKNIVKRPIPKRQSSFSSSVLIELQRGWLEVSPAAVDREGRIVVPDQTQRRWIPTNHLMHEQYTRQQDQISNGMYTNLIRLFKWWQHNNLILRTRQRYLSGFVLECLVAQEFDGRNTRSNILEEFAEVMRRIQHELKGRSVLAYVTEIGVPKGRKPTGLSRDEFSKLVDIVEQTIRLTERAHGTENIAKELLVWQRIFGDRFPTKL